MRFIQPKLGWEIHCAQCGKLKYYKRSQILNGSRFCCLKCSVIFWKGKPRNYTDEDRKKRVLNLGTRMLGKKHSEETKKKMSLASKGKPKPYLWGEKSPLWKGGKSLKKQIRDCLKYKQYRRDSFIRDNFQCIWGGKKHGNKLQVDHIKPFGLILKEYNIKTFEQALNCEELWDLKNSRTLCKECHETTDSYGWKAYHLLYH